MNRNYFWTIQLPAGKLVIPTTEQFWISHFSRYFGQTLVWTLWRSSNFALMFICEQFTLSHSIFLRVPFNCNKIKCFCNIFANLSLLTILAWNGLFEYNLKTRHLHCKEKSWKVFFINGRPIRSLTIIFMEKLFAKTVPHFLLLRLFEHPRGFTFKDCGFSSCCKMTIKVY